MNFTQLLLSFRNCHTFHSSKSFLFSCLLNSAAFLTEFSEFLKNSTGICKILMVKVVSVIFRINLWGLRFSQNANQKLQEFLPYNTNKDRSILFGEFLVSFFGCGPCLFGRAEILVTLGLHFGRKDVSSAKFCTKNLFC